MTERDHEATCSSCAAPTRRTFSRVQRPIPRPLGFGLSPGDRGYWDFESKDGRLAPHQQRQYDPFAKQEDFEKHPPKPVPVDTTVYLED